MPTPSPSPSLWLKAWWPVAIGALLYLFSCFSPSWFWYDPTHLHPHQWHYLQFSGGTLWFGTGWTTPDGCVAEMYGTTDGFFWNSESLPGWFPFPLPEWTDIQNSPTGVSEHIIPLWYLLFPCAWWSWRRWRGIAVAGKK